MPAGAAHDELLKARVAIGAHHQEVGVAVGGARQQHVSDIEAVVDRLLVKQPVRTRLADSLEVALKLSDGLVIIAKQDARTASLARWRRPLHWLWKQFAGYG